MPSTETIARDVTLRVRNVGGIEETSVAFSPGVTLLVGRNATNRTSFLQAVMAALGSDDVAIKGDADEASVELDLGDETCRRTLERQAGGVATSGESCLDDPELGELFAFLLESNEARRAVAAGTDLRELIMRPVDTEEIRTEIDRLVERRRSLERDLEAIDERKGDLVDLEESRATLRDRIAETRAELEETEAALDAADAGVEETREEQSRLEETLENLRAQRSALEDVRYDLETERESLDLLEAERRDLENERADLPDAPLEAIESLDEELRRRRDRKRRLETEVNELQNVIGFNEELLDGDGSSPVEGIVEPERENVTDQLVDDGVVCWTCGTEVEREQIRATVEGLRELSGSKVGDVNDLEAEIDALQSEKADLERAERERDRIDTRLDELATEIDRTEDAIDDLRARRETLIDDVERLESEVEDLESEAESAVLDLHREANQLEYELGRLESDLDSVESEIAEVEGRIDEREAVERERDDVTAEIEALRTKIDGIEGDAVAAFNEHMDAVLELLAYDNLERIWIERVEREVREGRRTVTERVFELHVVRTSESGVAYEDTVDHLSESEREVTGLVVALAGYLVHEVYEDVPVMLLDSLEAVDAERIAALVEYLTEYTEYLLVALLPEDAAALSGEYERVTEI